MIYFEEENFNLFKKMAPFMDSEWYEHYLSLLINITGSYYIARDKIAESEITETILGFLEDDKIDKIPNNSKPFLYIARLMSALIDPINKKAVSFKLASKYFDLAIKMVPKNMANEETLLQILILYRHGLENYANRNHLINHCMKSEPIREYL
jgi:hypothetical protein